MKVEIGFDNGVWSINGKFSRELPVTHTASDDVNYPMSLNLKEIRNDVVKAGNPGEQEEGIREPVDLPFIFHSLKCDQKINALKEKINTLKKYPEEEQRYELQKIVDGYNIDNKKINHVMGRVSSGNKDWQHSIVDEVFNIIETCIKENAKYSKMGLKKDLEAEFKRIDKLSVKDIKMAAIKGLIEAAGFFVTTVSRVIYKDDERLGHGKFLGKRLNDGTLSEDDGDKIQDFLMKRIEELTIPEPRQLFEFLKRKEQEESRQ